MISYQRLTAMVKRRSSDVSRGRSTMMKKPDRETERREMMIHVNTNQTLTDPFSHIQSGVPNLLSPLSTESIKQTLTLILTLTLTLIFSDRPIGLSHTTDRRENHLSAIHSQALVDIEPM
ncbi:hypothetical protein ACSBR1_028552 [Camellia fascicularis]